jgi:hypothetical protein
MPDMVVRCAATVPLDHAGGDGDVATGSGNLTSRLDGVEWQPECARRETERWAERLSKVLRAALVHLRHGRAPEAHDLKQQLRRVARGQIRELVDPQTVEAALDRREHRGQRFGDEAWADSGTVNRAVAAPAGVFDGVAHRRF